MSLVGRTLRPRQTGQEISEGPAFQKHVIDNGEFPGIRRARSSLRTFEDSSPTGSCDCAATDATPTGRTEPS